MRSLLRYMNIKRKAVSEHKRYFKRPADRTQRVSSERGKPGGEKVRKQKQSVL